VSSAWRGEPHLDPAFDVLGRLVQRTAHDRAHVVVGLQQPRDELALVRADQRRGLLQVDVGAVPLRPHVAIPVPPAGVVGLQRHAEDRRHLARIADPVEPEQVDHVALLEADLAVLEPVDLPLGGADGLAGLLPSDAGVQPQPPQAGADQHPPDGRAARWAATSP
jgi:hypothetical protein